MKSLVVCCDGTWQNISQSFQTNVASIAQAVEPVNEQGDAQILFYDEGVGNNRGVWPALTSKLGGAFGSGLDDNIREAYRFLAANYIDGDSIYVFGFSRGAYTARSLCGLINHAGLLKREVLDLEEKLLVEYRERKSNSDGLHRFQKINCTDVREARAIKYLGVWDTVGAVGIPDMLPFADEWNQKYGFHDISLSPVMSAARHAVAIDEQRKMFPVSLWSTSEIDEANQRADSCNKERPYQQLWFSGDHGNVGGGMADRRLSSIALLWILEGAMMAGLRISPAFTENVKRACERPPLFVEREAGKEQGFWRSLPYSLGGYAPRAGPSNVMELHESVVRRLREKAEYKPVALSRLKGKC